MTVYIGGVQTFREVKPDKVQALKPLEEAAEVFGAWQNFVAAIKLAEKAPEVDDKRCQVIEIYKDIVVDECADAIQAVCNLLASIGVTDLREAMERCAERNRARGRL